VDGAEATHGDAQVPAGRQGRGRQRAQRLSVGGEAQTYLSFGTRLVWVVWPHYQRVDVWHPDDETPTPRGVEDTLEGEDVIPGFSYPIASLFR